MEIDDKISRPVHVDHVNDGGMGGGVDGGGGSKYHGNVKKNPLGWLRPSRQSKQKLGSQDIDMNERRPGQGQDAAMSDGHHGLTTTAITTGTQYRTYKRRWFGLVQLTLMNVIVSWDVSLDLASSFSSHLPSSHLVGCNVMD